MSWLTGEHLVVAHRGASRRAPENTLEAFELALEEGADGVELDVRTLADGTLVVFHDAAINGVALASMDLDDWSKASRGLGREPCTLDDALDALAGRALLDIELKEPATVEAVAATLEARGGPLERVLVTSFWDAAVAGMAERLPQVATGLLLGRERPHRLVRTRVSELFPGRRLAACNAQVVAPNVGLLRAGFTRRARRGRWPVLVWTVNEGRRLAQLLGDARVAGVITDDPSLALEVRAGLDWTGVA